MERTEKIMGHTQTASLAFEPIAYERVSVQEANQAVADKRPAFQKNWTRVRQPELPEPLLHTTSAWLAELPREVRTLMLAQRFPRIANKLARLWRNPVQFERYISELLLVRRGDSIRQGFPPEVARELVALSYYFSALYLEKAAVVEWSIK
jgi:hypothetical protein